MIVKIYFGPNYERMVECDTVYVKKNDDNLELGIYKNGKLIENPKFRDPVAVYFMENGKTVDRIDFDSLNRITQKTMPIKHEVE